jgi:hypothetical protein
MYPILDIVLCLYMIPNQPKAKPHTPPHLQDLALTPLPHTLIHPLEMHVYLIDKFSLYNLKMANIYGQNM